MLISCLYYGTMHTVVNYSKFVINNNEVGDCMNSLSDKIYEQIKEDRVVLYLFFFNKCRPLTFLSHSLLGISPFRYRSLGVPVSAAMCCCDSFFCRSRNACLFAAAIGQPERLLCVFRFELTCPRPLHPGVGHFRIVSCKAKTGQDNIYTHIYIYLLDWNRFCNMQH